VLFHDVCCVIVLVISNTNPLFFFLTYEVQKCMRSCYRAAAAVWS
jgi:hypothetical protein